MRTIADQMIHDVAGKATVLSIMNELHSNEVMQVAIDKLIEFILTQRAQMSEKFEESPEINGVNKALTVFLEEVENKSQGIIDLTEDEDILSAIKSLICVCLGYKMILNNVFDIETVRKIAQNKNIIFSGASNQLDLVVCLMLIVKDSCSIKTETDQIIVRDLNYDFFKSGNGLLTFLKEKYEIQHEFFVGANKLIIRWLTK